MGFQKLNPKIIAYRDYKNFDNAKFRYDIVTATFNMDNFGMYKSTIFNIFNHHVPIKKKYIRANEAPFMSKELHKAIMKRSRLRNIFLKRKTNTNEKNNSTQFNQFFSNVVPTLNIPKPKSFPMASDNLDPIMSVN